MRLLTLLLLLVPWCCWRPCCCWFPAVDVPDVPDAGTGLLMTFLLFAWSSSILLFPDDGEPRAAMDEGECGAPVLRVNEPRK